MFALTPKVNRAEKDSDMGVIVVIRQVTKTVKVFPFLYTLGLILFWTISPIFSESAISLIDSMVFLSALLAVFLVRLSYCLKLCIWHRLQCVLPLIPQFSAIIDANVWEFGLYSAIINLVIMIGVFTLSLFNAYKVFIKPVVRNNK